MRPQGPRSDPFISCARLAILRADQPIPSCHDRKASGRPFADSAARMRASGQARQDYHISNLCEPGREIEGWGILFRISLTPSRIAFRASVLLARALALAGIDLSSISDGPKVRDQCTRPMIFRLIFNPAEIVCVTHNAQCQCTIRKSASVPFSNSSSFCRTVQTEVGYENHPDLG